MKVVRILNAEAIRLIRILPERGQTLYGINLIRAFESRYGFMQSPKTLDELDLTKGITFLHGYYNNQSVIDRAQIFNAGILVNCKDGTETCDAIIDDIIQWATETAGVKFEDPQALRIYNNSVEVEMAGDFAGSFERFNGVAAAISDAVRSYGLVLKGYEPIAVHFGTKVEGPTPNPFRFERRAEAPLDSNLFWSAAPLTSKDHERILELFEKTISFQSIA